MQRRRDLAVAVLVVVGPFTVSMAHADTPAFDRPGIAFSTSVLPVGGASIELGLPDFEHDAGQGDHATLYSADGNLRVGLGHELELQLGSALFNHLDARSAGVSDSTSGFGDSSLALKWAPSAPLPALSWAVLGAVSVPTGAKAFTADKPQYDLGTTVAYALGEQTSASFYVDANYFDGDLGWTVSPALSWALSDRLGTYVEAGLSFGPASPTTAVAGGGVTWMLTPTVQLDASLDFGLDADSPDLAGGFGLSWFIP